MTDEELHNIMALCLDELSVASVWLQSAMEAFDEGRRCDARQLLRQASVALWVRRDVFERIEPHL